MGDVVWVTFSPGYGNASVEPILAITLGKASQRTGGWHLRQPTICMFFQASTALCRSMRLWLCGTGGFGLTQRYVLKMTHWP